MHSGINHVIACSPAGTFRCPFELKCVVVTCVIDCVRAGTGGLRLLDGGALSGLLQLLSERDMPVDMLQLLVYMAEDGCRYVCTHCVPGDHGRSSVHVC